jgi:hypothetical protein
MSRYGESSISTSAENMTSRFIVVLAVETPL